MIITSAADKVRAARRAASARAVGWPTACRLQLGDPQFGPGSIARSLKRTAIAAGLKAIEALFTIGRALQHVGRWCTVGLIMLGGRFARAVVPLYRCWWTFRRSVAMPSLQRPGWLSAALTSRFTTHAMFAIVVLLIAAQAIHAREYGGFTGSRPLLKAFVTSEEDGGEEFVEGPALPPAHPTFRTASVGTAFQPAVLGAEAVAPLLPATTGFALVQPIITDAAVEESGRAGTQVYAVEVGDTPSTIAERFHLELSTVLWENALSMWSVIRPGDQLRILPTDGVTHTVRRGDTLESIAKRYRADAEEILEFNRLVDADDIEVGDLLVIPGGQPPAAPPVVRRQPTRPSAPLPSMPGKLSWPSVAGYRISQYFTWRHHGLDIAVSHGTPVFASDAGTVASSGWLRGYGYQVLLDHGSAFQTRYAHNSQLLVRKGEPVVRGQPIALVGSTGRSSGPHIHFEVYANGRRLNPLRYLR